MFRRRRPAPIMLGYRSQKRVARVGEKKRRTRIFVIACLLILLLTPVLWMSVFKVAPLIARWRAGPSVRVGEPDHKTLLLIGTEKKRNKQVAHLTAVVLFEPGQGKIGGLSIKEDTFLEVPGHGFERIGDAMNGTGGVGALQAAIRNFLGVKIDGYAKLPYRRLEEMLANSKIEDVFNEASETDVRPADRKPLDRALAKVRPAEVNIVSLPVEPVSVGSETYYEPQKDEVVRLVGIFWKKQSGGKVKQIRLIILNGNGAPGVAGRAAEVLIDRGYRVVETKNADAFDYRQTQIIVYHRKDVDEGFKVKDILGVGLVVSRTMEQDVADIGIVIGKDYKPDAAGGGGGQGAGQGAGRGAGQGTSTGNGRN